MSNGSFACRSAVVVSHGSPLVGEVLVEALVLSDLPARSGTAAGPDELLVSDRPPADVVVRPGSLGRAQDLDSLVAMLRHLMAGRSVPGAVPFDPPQPLPQLTERERQVLVLLALGRSNDALAAELSISPHTVRTHVQNLFAKLGVPNRLAAAAVAHHHGLVAMEAS